MRRGKPLKRTRLNAVSKKRAAEIAAGIPAKKRPVKKVAKKPKGISIYALDRLFSDYIRRGGKCEVCLGPCTDQLQCSHIRSRRFPCTRWEPLNAVTQCAGCHRRAHNCPDMFIAKIQEQWPGRIEAINEIWLRADKPDRDEIAAFLRAELAKLR